MAKIKFPRQHPRSIVQKRHDHPSSLSVSIPKRIVQSTAWKAGDVLEFVSMREGTEWQEQYVKVRKVSDY
jgi:hypothetical protein